MLNRFLDNYASHAILASLKRLVSFFVEFLEGGVGLGFGCFL